MFLRLGVEKLVMFHIEIYSSVENVTLLEHVHVIPFVTNRGYEVVVGGDDESLC